MKKHRTLSLFLKEARIKSGFSQKDVSDELGYSTAQFVSNWERGLSTPPGRTLRKLAKFYKVSAEDLYEVLLDETLNRVENQLKKEFYG
jgi:transcriptional regulator with XRE-family HTH domain